jgi:hypothetical protein
MGEVSTCRNRCLAFKNSITVMTSAVLHFSCVRVVIHATTHDSDCCRHVSVCVFNAASMWLSSQMLYKCMTVIEDLVVI